MDPSEFCRALADELNVKRVSFCTPLLADFAAVDVCWTATRGLHVAIGGVCQDDTAALARRLWDEFVRPGLRGMP